MTTASAGWLSPAWAADELFIANYTGNSVTVYSRTASGNTAPLRTLSGAATGLARPHGVRIVLSAVCGNSTTESGEQCDDGAANGTAASCCSATCSFASAATICTFGTSQGGACNNDAADHCTGSSTACVDAFKASTVECRAAADLCDPAESCTGSSGACPADYNPSCPPPPDSDADGVPNAVDNCPADANRGQADADGDRVGDICDSAPDVFNADQSDGNGNDVADVVDSGTPTSLTVQRVLLRANTSGTDFGNGRLTVRGQFDTTELGGVDGLRDALRQGFAVGVSGAGMSETQALFFPPCVAVAVCDGSNGESASFIRKRNSNVFTLRIVAQQRSFGPPLSSAPVTAVLSLGGLDRRDDTSSCRVRTRGVTAGCR